MTLKVTTLKTKDHGGRRTTLTWINLNHWIGVLKLPNWNTLSFRDRRNPVYVKQEKLFRQDTQWHSVKLEEWPHSVVPFRAALAWYHLHNDPCGTEVRISSDSVIWFKGNLFHNEKTSNRIKQNLSRDCCLGWRVADTFNNTGTVTVFFDDLC